MRRVTGILVAALAAAACALPATSAARPGDAVFYIKVPGDGAVVADASHGVDVQLTCPTYHRNAEDFLWTEPTEGYHVILSRTGTVDEQSGLLSTAGHVDVREVEEADEVGLCRPAADVRGMGFLPPEPGRYWLQAYRECATFLCRAGVDVSDVTSFTVRRTVCTVLRTELRQARRSLAAAQRALGRAPRSATRRARVRRLQDRVRALRSRARVVHDCRGV